MTKKVYIKTYGCQMNVYDSVRMKDVLVPEGYAATETIEEADLVLLNTCHIREKAAEKVYSDLGRIKRVKKARAHHGKQTVIGVAGCVAQAEGEEIKRRTPYVDLVIGSQAYHELPQMLKGLPPSTRAARAPPPEGGEGSALARPEGGNNGVHLDFPEVQKFDLLPQERLSQGVSAFVSVQEGCDKFCTFCVVPYTRGGEYSRPVQVVVDEVKDYVAKGAVEVTLLGQNVNAYHGEAVDGSEWRLGQLIEELAKIDGLERIRFTTSHPRDMSDDLFEAFRDIPKLMPYFHLPVQAGSDRILKAMNRKHTAAEYIATIERLRSMRQDIAFSGDFIVGFPGESDEDFEATMRLVEMVHYASAYSFKYSPRPGTPGAEMEGQVGENAKVERLARLQELLNTQQRQFNKQSFGKRMKVLLDRPGKYEDQLIGRSPYMQAVHVRGTGHMMNQLVEVDIVESRPNSLAGELVDAGEKAA